MKITATATPAGTDRTLEVGSVKIPMPRWATMALASIVLVGICVGGSVYGYVWFHDHSKHDDATLKRVAEAEFVQLEESQKHFSEPPEYAVPIYQDARGLLKVSLYRSDSCILIERHAADPTRPVVNQFITDPARAAVQAPPKFAQHRLISLEGVAEASQGTPGPGRCWPDEKGPHPGVFRWWAAEKSADGCWTRIHRQWEDTCEQTQDFNGCANVWGPTVTWLRCVGH